MERKTKVLALVAHDNMKRDLAEWVDWNSRKLSRHHLVCTGTTGKMVEKTLRDHRCYGSGTYTAGRKPMSI